MEKSDGWVLGIEDQPQVPKYDLTVTGLYLYDGVGRVLERCGDV